MNDLTNDPNFLKLAPENFTVHNDESPMLIETFVELMKHFYNMGWMRGSGGAMGCISGNRLMISPSSLQKERMKESDVYVYDLIKKALQQKPINRRITVSSCATLFTLIMHHTGSECVIHTHSKAANLITQLISGPTFEISHQEYIKGIYNPFSGHNLRYDDTLVIPIIDNKPSENQLLQPIAETLDGYPQTVAVLVRNHGLFVWGPTWEATKIMVECIDYLLDLSIDMIKLDKPLVKEEEVPNVAERSDYLKTVFNP
ncbi:unnamed protein product [Caenorhabditis bovis]|uniref:Class II aldolase/adducin N-terminal domain-containing protein n=1 Tax=Caenorhabditis bovis TaxID=2654633 RepID=A0A8S1F8H1_9PELO|nr:unnamed protein product [Caenorhabditis bovis]